MKEREWKLLGSVFYNLILTNIQAGITSTDRAKTFCTKASIVMALLLSSVSLLVIKHTFIPC